MMKDLQTKMCVERNFNYVNTGFVLITRIPEEQWGMSGFTLFCMGASGKVMYLQVSQ